jgi:hypothetical protein
MIPAIRLGPGQELRHLKLDTPHTNKDRGLASCLTHSVRGLATHARQHVGVSVEGDDY